MKLNFAWKENKLQYQSGESLYLNRIRVASYCWNSFKSRDNPGTNNRYSGTVSLPQISKTFYSDNENTLKEQLKKAVTGWVTEILK